MPLNSTPSDLPDVTLYQQQIAQRLQVILSRVSGVQVRLSALMKELSFLHSEVTSLSSILVISSPSVMDLGDSVEGD